MNWNHWTSSGTKTNGLNVIDREAPTLIPEQLRILWTSVIYQSWLDAIVEIKPHITGHENQKRRTEKRILRAVNECARKTAREWFQKDADTIYAFDKEKDEWVRLPRFEELCGYLDLNGGLIRAELQRVINGKEYRRRNFIKLVTNRRKSATGNPVYEVA